MSAATIIADAFGEGANLYTTVLALPSAGQHVTAAQLRKAYYKRALTYHPDKQQGKSQAEVESSKAKFQAISVAYSILSNSESRSEYDETGELHEDDECDADKSGTEAWEEYFRGIFGKVTTDDIDKFEAQYKCSDEEERDVLKYYNHFKGDLNKMLECVMLSQNVDKKRWVEDYIQPAIERGDAKDYKEALERTVGGFPDEVQHEDDEETESEDDSDDAMKDIKPKHGKKKPGKKDQPRKKKTTPKHRVGHTPRNKTKTKADGPSEDLIAAIRGRSVARSGASFGALLDGLEQRYISSNKKRKGRENDGRDNNPVIADDEFEKIQARLENNRRKNRGSKR